MWAIGVMTGETQVHVDKRRRGRTPQSLWRWMKRRAAIEPGIGHWKREHRMDRNRLAGVIGGQMNAILCAAGMNFYKLFRSLATFLLAPVFAMAGAMAQPETSGLGLAKTVFSASTNWWTYPKSPKMDAPCERCNRT